MGHCTRAVQSAKGQSELVTDVKAIKASQKNIETKIVSIEKRLDTLEDKTKSLDNVQSMTTDLMSTFTTKNNSLNVRIDELEDRSRRQNLLFRGFPDSPETWAESEARVIDALAGVLESPLDNAVERAHRLGRFVPNKTRPIMVKFSNDKIKEAVLFRRSRLKEKGITVSEDFSPATRIIRSKLIAFAKKQPGAPLFQLRYKKLLINKKEYVYNATDDTVAEHAQNAVPQNRHASNTPRASE